MMSRGRQLLFAANDFDPEFADRSASTFTDNMRLPVHRWFRFSAGFSALWAESVIREHAERGPTVVLDPFAGSGTTLLAAEDAGVESYGIEAHPFVARVARAKLARRSDPEKYRNAIARVNGLASSRTPDLDRYPTLIRSCYDDGSLSQLDVLRQALSRTADGAEESELAWLTLVGILRRVSHANTAQWQYVLPKKSKRSPENPATAFEQLAKVIDSDIRLSQNSTGPRAVFRQTDARTCDGVPLAGVNLVLTSPPYPNNYDYADATRLEMSFMREINGWGDLQGSVRHRLIRSCSQHVPARAVDLESVLSSELLNPIERDIRTVCGELGRVRVSKSGRKTYHLMVACYFLDLAGVWRALRSVCTTPSEVCFVIGDSAPYGVYVPVIEWLGKLAVSAGFKSFRFERTRDRNVKWKNRKHRVPLCEGRLWVEG
jgi:DNA methylase